MSLHFEGGRSLFQWKPMGDQRTHIEATIVLFVLFY